MELTYETRGRGAATVSRGLPLEHRLHAIGMLVVPPCMTVYAVYDAVLNGLRVTDVSLFLFFYVLSAIGITVGYHRLLSHGAFKAHPTVRTVLAILGSTAGEGPPLYWAANHRRHHDLSDRPGDPHSPYFRDEEAIRGLHGFLHSHAGWTIGHRLTNTLRYCPDLLRDARLSWVGRHYFRWLALGFLAPALVGAAISGSLEGAWHGLLWGGFVRIFVLYHVTLSINSVAHLYGRRDFDVPDHSRNVIWLALPSLGEAWHNNHHAFPSSAYFGLRRWQLDLGGLVISALQRLGLASDVRRPSSQALEDKLKRRRHITARSLENP